MPAAAGEEAGVAAIPRIEGVRTLVVDDNRDSAETMAAVLRLLGSDARAVYDGEQALDWAQRFHPDVVLLDLNMPEVNGYAVLRRLRELPMQRRPYVAAMTGYGHVGDRARTLAAGFDAHLIKPVDVEQLREMLAHAARGGA